MRVREAAAQLTLNWLRVRRGSWYCLGRLETSLRSLGEGPFSTGLQKLYLRKLAGRISIMPMHAERRRPWDYGPGLWGCCFGGPWRRPSRREKTEALKDHIAELKEELQDAEERLKDLEK